MDVLRAVLSFKSNSERQKKAWEFVKWWSSTETQAEFGQTIQITYGGEYIWPTANTKAFAQLPINSDTRRLLKRQQRMLRTLREFRVHISSNER